MDRPRRRERLSRPLLDARPDRRHQGVPPRRAVCRRAGTDRRAARSWSRRWRVPAWTPVFIRRPRRGGVRRTVEGGGRVARPGRPVRTCTSADRDDPESGRRFCESVESGHSAHGDAASVAERLGITAAPLRMDSQAKYAVVARGEADIYLRLPTRAEYREKIWDHAAGALIVAEAGGTVTDIHGRPLEFHHGRELAANRGVIVSNGRLHDRVLEAIATCGIGEESPASAGSRRKIADSDIARFKRRENSLRFELIGRIPDASLLLRGLGRGLPGGVRLAGRAARRADRLARHPAGRGVPGPGRPVLGTGADGLLAAADACSGSTRPTGPCTRCAGAGWALVRRWSPASCPALPGALVDVLPVVDRGRAGFSQLSMGYAAARIRAAGPAIDALGPAADRADDEPWSFAVWLFRWLVFRLMFLSGVVKLTYGDPVWLSWRALEYHYWTQPLPAWTSWYIHQMPAWFHRLSIAFMFYAELVAPFFVFGPRVLRRIGFASLVLLQLLIMATGNYGFFNLLAIVLCLSVLDDRDLRALRSRSDRAQREGELRPSHPGKPARRGSPARLVAAASRGRRDRGRHPRRGDRRANDRDGLAGCEGPDSDPGARAGDRTAAERQLLWPVPRDDHRASGDHRRGE